MVSVSSENIYRKAEASQNKSGFCRVCAAVTATHARSIHGPIRRRLVASLRRGELSDLDLQRDRRRHSDTDLLPQKYKNVRQKTVMVPASPKSPRWRFIKPVRPSSKSTSIGEVRSSRLTIRKAGGSATQSSPASSIASPELWSSRPVDRTSLTNINSANPPSHQNKQTNTGVNRWST